MIQDLRYGIRMLLRNPGFTVVAILTLALGIGANTAIFSVVNAVLLKPLAYGEPDRIVLLWTNNSGLKLNLPISPLPVDLIEWRKQSASFEQIAALRPSTADLSEDGDPERVAGVEVTSNFFAVMGVHPQIGRDFSLAEEQPNQDKVVIISHDLWRRRFGGENIIGRLITINRERRMVIGVMPPQFLFPRGAEFAGYGLPPRTDVWVPYAESAAYWRRDDMREYGAIGRLKRGVPLALAQAEMDAIARRQEKDSPNNHVGWTIQLQPLASLVTQESRPVLFVLLGAVGFVLLIACANVANLLLCRSSARQKEMAVRAALGAGWSRIVRQLLSESLLLSVAGGATGLLVGAWSLPAILSLSPPNIARLNEIKLDWQVLLFTVFVSLITGVLFGLAPAWHSSRINLTGMLNAGGRSLAAAGRRRMQNLLVITEVALAVALLAGAGLTVQSLLHLHAVDPGFRAEQVASFDVGLHGGEYSNAERMRRFYRETRERLSRIPGIRAVGASSVIPLQGGGDNQWIIPEGYPIDFSNTVNANRVEITPGYLETMGMTLLRGRDFNDYDTENSLQVCLINETTARDFFPGADPIGKRLRLGGTGNPWFTVVGIVRDVRFEALEIKVRPQVYRPVAQNTDNLMTFVVRADGVPAETLERTLRAELKAIDSTLPLANFRTMESLVADALARPRFSAFLLSLFAVTALLLTVVGLYGVVAYAVSQRTQEIGIRIALGASGRNVLSLVIRQGMMSALSGLLVGVLCAFGLTRVLATQLYGVKPADLPTFICVSLILLLAAFAACWFPARQATRVDAVIALRQE